MKTFDHIINPDPLFTEREAADYLRVSRRSLAQWRLEVPLRLEYIRAGRGIRYRRSVLDNFLAMQTTVSDVGVMP